MTLPYCQIAVTYSTVAYPLTDSKFTSLYRPFWPQALLSRDIPVLKTCSEILTFLLTAFKPTSIIICNYLYCKTCVKSNAVPFIFDSWICIKIEIMLTFDPGSCVTLWVFCFSVSVSIRYISFSSHGSTILTKFLKYNFPSGSSNTAAQHDNVKPRDPLFWNTFTTELETTCLWTSFHMPEKYALIEM